MARNERERMDEQAAGARVERVGPVRALVEAWLRADFFGGMERRGSGAPLVTALAFQSFCSSLFAILLFTELPDVDFYLASLAFCGVLTALTVLGDLGAVLRDPRHARIVAHLPLRPGELARARLSHGGIYLGLVSTAIAIPPAVLSLWVSGTLLGPLVYLLAALHQAALLGLLIAWLQGFSGGRATSRWMSWIQILLVVGAMLLFFLGIRYLPRLPELRAENGELFCLLPPAWFAGEMAFLLPFEVAVEDRLVWAAPAWILTAALVPLVWWSFTRGARAVDQGGAAQPSATGGLRLWRLAFAPRASRTERAAYDFALQMLSRDRDFRLRAYPLFGFPFAMLAAGLWSESHEDQGLYLNLVIYTLNAYLPLILAFLAYSPHWRASWAFHVLPLASREHFQRGFQRALITSLLLPVYLALLVVYLWLRPWDEALRQSATAFLVAVLLLPRSFGIVLQSPPFSHPPERIQAVHGEGNSWSARMFALAIILAVVSFVAYRLLTGWALTLAVDLLLLVALWWTYGIRSTTRFEPLKELAE